MSTLFKYEFKKIMSMKIVWVIIFLTIFICVSYGFLMTPETPEQDWKTQYTETIEELKKSKEELEQEIGEMLSKGEEVDAFYHDTVSSMETMVIKYEYAIRNNIPIEQTSRVGFLTRALPIISFGTILLFVIIASTAISNEVANGKIKCLLLRPISRNDIFLSKYTAMVFSSFVIVSLIVCSVYCFSMAYFDNLHAIDLVVDNGMVREIDLRTSLLISTVNMIANLLVFETVAFSFSAFFTHSVTPVVLSICLYVGLQLSNAALTGLKFYKYLPIKTIDITRIVNTHDWKKIIELAFGDIVIVFIFVNALIIISNRVFAKKDL